MFWWYLHPSPQLFADSSYFPLYQTLCLFFFFSFLNLQDQFVLPKCSSIVVFRWSAVDVPGTEKNNLPSPSYQLPVAPWLGVGLCANSFLHTEIRSHQGLCMPLKPLWVHVCRCSVVSRRWCFLIVSHHLWILHSLCSLTFLQWSLNKGDNRR